MFVKVFTLINNINALPNNENVAIILSFYNYMKDKGSSENHQSNNLKVVIDFAKFLGEKNFYDVNKKDQVLSYLNIKIKSVEQDPDKRWVTTWNHFLNRTRLFYRWLYNSHRQQSTDNAQESENEWITLIVLR